MSGAKKQEEKTTLRWRGYQSRILDVLGNPPSRAENYDVQLVSSEGAPIPSSQLVLSLSSTYFAEIFENSRQSVPVVILKDVSLSTLNAVLELIYQGEVSVDETETMAIIELARELRIEGEIEDDNDHSPSLLEGFSSQPQLKEETEDDLESNKSNDYTQDPEETQFTSLDSGVQMQLSQNQHDKYEPSQQSLKVETVPEDIKQERDITGTSPNLRDLNPFIRVLRRRMDDKQDDSVYNRRNALDPRVTTRPRKMIQRKRMAPNEGWIDMSRPASEYFPEKKSCVSTTETTIIPSSSLRYQH